MSNEPFDFRPHTAVPHLATQPLLRLPFLLRIGLESEKNLKHFCDHNKSVLYTHCQVLSILQIASLYIFNVFCFVCLFC